MMRYQSQRREALVTRITFSGQQGLEFEDHRPNGQRVKVLARGEPIREANNGTRIFRTLKNGDSP